VPSELPSVIASEIASQVPSAELNGRHQQQPPGNNINQSINPINQLIAFGVFRTHQMSQQTMPMKLLRMLNFE
jgi:hypothetical protein